MAAIDFLLLAFFSVLPIARSERTLVYSLDANCDSDGRHFRCSSGKCIPNEWLCDGTPDCRDSEDEHNELCEPLGARKGVLERGKCPSLHFECDAKCIPEAWRCDNHRDCANGEDEASCDQAAPPVHFPPLRPIFTENKAAVKCEPDKFRCRRFAACIPARFRCNGMRDCRDGSDEEDCEQPTSPPKEAAGSKGEKKTRTPMSRIVNGKLTTSTARAPSSSSPAFPLPSASPSRSLTKEQARNQTSSSASSSIVPSASSLAVSRPIASTGGHRAPVNVVMRDAIRPTEINVSPVSAVDNKPKRMSHRPAQPSDQNASAQTARPTPSGQKEVARMEQKSPPPAKRFILPMDHFPAIVPVL